MANRGLKRNETEEGLPADKRACSSMKFEASTSNSSAQRFISSALEAHDSHDADMDTLSSTSGSKSEVEVEGEKESAYESCDSENSARDHYRNRSSHDHNKFKKVLTGLSDEVDESAQLALLTELCDLLSFCSDNALSSMLVDSISPILVQLARHESNPNIMLLAIRAITYLCDASPRSTVFLARHDVVPALCERLLKIEYLDVAEQCLQALEKISREQQALCLQSGVIMASLSFIDFFSTSVQRVALSTVVNTCKKLSSESPILYMEAVPILCNLLQYEDRQLVESVATCLIKIGEQVCSSSDMLDEFCKHGLVQHTLHLISLNGRTTLSQPTCTGLIGLLVKLAIGSNVAFKTLFELNVSNIVKHLICGYDLNHGMQNPTLDGHHSQINEVLKLLNELLPAITADDQQKSDKEAFLLNNSNILEKFGIDLLPILIQVVNSGVNLFICYRCIYVINKLVHFSTSDVLHNLLQTVNFSSFLAGVFARKEHHLVFLALRIVETIMLKLPHVYLDSFVKEGVLFAIYAIICPVKDLSLCPGFNGIRLENDATSKSTPKDVRICPCFAFDTCQVSKSRENDKCQLHSDTVQSLAKLIWATYFETESQNPEKGETSVLQKLRTLSTDLEAVVYSSQWGEEIYGLLGRAVSELNEKNSISTFEFVESGIVHALVHYLSNATLEEDYNAAKRMDIMETRCEVFGRLLLSCVDTFQEEFPLLTLVRRLQSALSSTENFTVISSHMCKGRNSYATVPYGRCTSYPCLKVQFVRENDEDCLSDYGEDVVHVDPFVPLDEITGYLWRKVCDNNVKKMERCSSHSNSPLDSSTSVGKIPEAIESMEMLVDDDKQGVKMTFSSPPAETSSSAHKPVESAADVQIDYEEQVVHDSDTCHPGSNEDKYTSRKLLLYFKGQKLNHQLTLYQSLVKVQKETHHDYISIPSLWAQIHRITYRRNVITKPSCVNCIHQEHLSSDLPKRTSVFKYIPFCSCIVVDLGKLGPSYEILSLLKNVEKINRLGFHLMSRGRTSDFAEGRSNDFDKLNIDVYQVPQNEFVNSKLTEKLEQQMRDPMTVSVGAMPAWCTQLIDCCPFLFGFEARCKYFQLAAFNRCLNQPISTAHTDSGGSSGRHQNHYAARKKILVHRNKILESATKMMELRGLQKMAAEVEYSEEVGTGLGPTLEFYTLVCHEFQRSGLGMWRDDHYSRTCFEADNHGLLLSTSGLFPYPFPPSLSTSSSEVFSDVIKKFSLLGQIVAKALEDGRVLDLPFSKAFYKLILGKELTLFDIQLFDPTLCKTLLEFQAIIERREFLRSICEESSDEFGLCLRNTKIEDLCLEFSLPGYPDYVFDSKFNSELVNLDNLEEYVELVVDATVKSGISRQVEAFKSGFDQVFPIRHLKIFSEQELERLLCGEHVMWNSDELLDHIKFDHGYTISSPPIVNLIEIMREFDIAQQRAFLQFVTGAPRLPTGGLASLNPKLTIVRKHCSKGIDVDLPSVMTCANYLKLPPYSSKDIMKEKLSYAITEGQGSFHLS